MCGLFYVVTMSPAPTGRVHKIGDAGYDIVIERSFAAPIDDVWASVTESDRTALWYGPWSGSAEVGAEIAVTMAFEEGKPTSGMTIAACSAPHQLRLTSATDFGFIDVEIRLAEDDGHTALTFIQHLDDPAMAEHMGPGWEYYIDNLVAARAGEPLPVFEEYLTQCEHYVKQANEAAK